MKAPLRLFLVRHGQVAANRELRYIGRRDEPLTELGVKQADRLGQALAPLPIDRVVSSPLVRTTATARWIATACGLEVELEVRLAEQHFGDWEGLSRAEIDQRGEAEILRRFDRDSAVTPPNLASARYEVSMAGRTHRDRIKLRASTIASGVAALRKVAAEVSATSGIPVVSVSPSGSPYPSPRLLA